MIPLLQKNTFVKELGYEEILKLAGEMQKVTFEKNDPIIKYGDVAQYYYVLQKGKIRITEYEPNTCPGDQDLENKISMVKYVSKEGHGIGEESIQNFTPLKASIDAMDHCEFYMVDGFLINEILTRVSSYKKSHQSKPSIGVAQHLLPPNIRHSNTGRQKLSFQNSGGADSRSNTKPNPSSNQNESFASDSQKSHSRGGQSTSLQLVQQEEPNNNIEELLKCDLSTIKAEERTSININTSRESESKSVSCSKSHKVFSSEMNYNSFIDTEDKFGICPRDFNIFGDRVPKGYQKIRLLSKSLNQLYWLTKNKHDSLLVMQQIPKSLPNYDVKLKMLVAE